MMRSDQQTSSYLRKEEVAKEFSPPQYQRVKGKTLLGASWPLIGSCLAVPLSFSISVSLIESDFQKQAQPQQRSVCIQFHGLSTPPTPPPAKTIASIVDHIPILHPHQQFHSCLSPQSPPHRFQSRRPFGD